MESDVIKDKWQQILVNKIPIKNKFEETFKETLALEIDANWI